MKFKEAADKILEFFKNSQVNKTSTVWEKMNDNKGWKWVLVLHNLNWGDVEVIHNKIILKADENKDELLKLQFSYLYDMNCQYRFVDFTDLNDLQSKLEKIITENKFGVNVKELSRFLINPAIKINDMLYKKGIENYSVFDFDYDPHYSIVPCKIISFDFSFDVNNNTKVHLNLKKEEDQDFIFRFQMNEQFTEIKVVDLKNIEGIIIQFIRNKIIKE